MAATLTQTEIDEALLSLPGWRQQDNALTADFSFRDFSDALIL
jgi:pterin-4a-carbinolamine dehydratase